MIYSITHLRLQQYWWWLERDGMHSYKKEHGDDPGLSARIWDSSLLNTRNRRWWLLNVNTMILTGIWWVLCNCWSNWYFPFLKSFIYLFIYLFIHSFILRVGGEREKERERNTNVWLCLMCPGLGTGPAIQACALTGNWTHDPLVHRSELNPLSHTSQGIFFFFLIKEDLESFLGKFFSSSLSITVSYLKLKQPHKYILQTGSFINFLWEYA